MANRTFASLDPWFSLYRKGHRPCLRAIFGSLRSLAASAIVTVLIRFLLAFHFFLGILDLQILPAFSIHYSFLVVSDSGSISAKCGFKSEARLMRTMAPNTVSDDCNEAVFSLSRRSASSSVCSASVFEAPSLFVRTSLHASAVSARRFDSNGFARVSNLIRSAIASVAFTEGVAGGLRLKPSAFSCLLQ